VRVEDPRLETLEGWAQHTEDLIRPALEAWAADKDKREAARLLCEQGVVAGPSNRAEDLAADPHVETRNMLIEVPRPDADRPYLVVGNPVKMSRAAEGPVGSPPGLGEHTDEVLGQELGLEGEALAGLRARGAIGP